MAEYYEGYPKQAGLYDCYIVQEGEEWGENMALLFWIDEMNPKKRGWRDPKTFELIDEETNTITWSGARIPSDTEWDDDNVLVKLEWDNAAGGYRTNLSYDEIVAAMSAGKSVYMSPMMGNVHFPIVRPEWDDAVLATFVGVNTSFGAPRLQVMNVTLTADNELEMSDAYYSLTSIE